MFRALVCLFWYSSCLGAGDDELFSALGGKKWGRVRMPYMPQGLLSPFAPFQRTYINFAVVRPPPVRHAQNVLHKLAEPRSEFVVRSIAKYSTRTQLRHPRALHSSPPPRVQHATLRARFFFVLFFRWASGTTNCLENGTDRPPRLACCEIFPSSLLPVCPYPRDQNLEDPDVLPPRCRQPHLRTRKQPVRMTRLQYKLLIRQTNWGNSHLEESW